MIDKRYYQSLGMTILVFIVGFTLLGRFEKVIDYFILGGMGLMFLTTLILFFRPEEKQEEEE